MDIEIVPLVSRWLHIGSVIVAVGGAVFLRFMLLPAAAETLGDEQRMQLRTAILRRWKRFIFVCIALILISGIYNFFRGVLVLGKPTLYHMLFLPKFLAAVAIFFIAGVSVGSSSTFENIRTNAEKWLGVVIVLAALIVILSGIMKNLPSQPAEADSPAASLWFQADPGFA